MDTDFELDENLLVTNMDELEEGEEYYIMCKNANTYSGIYTLVKNNKICEKCYLKTDKNSLKNYKKIELYYNYTKKELRFWHTVMFRYVSIKDAFNIYKLISTEYILK
jgi:hypothetical protein